MTNVFKKVGVISAVSLTLFLPLVSVVSAQTSNTGIVTTCPGDDGSKCDFATLVSAVKKVTDFAVAFGLAFSVVVLAVAGWKYMTSGGDTGKVQKAHEMFLSVAKGIFFILAAWFIVNLIMTTLVSSNIKNYIKN